MITLISMIVSFLSGSVPKILDFFQDKSDKSHELALAQLQMQQQLELQKLGYVAQKDLEEVKYSELQTQTASDQNIADINAQSAQMQAIYAQDTASAVGASTWVVNIRALVRPAITFGFFVCFVFVDVFGFYYAIHTNVPFSNAMSILWDEQTQVIWSSVVGFWFGARHFGKQ